MNINVQFIQSDSAFIPNQIGIGFTENGSMKQEVFCLRVFEVKELIDKLQKALVEEARSK